MRSVFIAVGFFLVVILITLIYKLPAQFVYQQLPPNKNIGLSDISGSIWSGHVDSINTPQLTLYNFSWHLSAWALLVGDIDVQWALDDSPVKLQGEVNLSGANLQVNNIKGHIDLLELVERIPAQEIVLGGKVILDISQVEFEEEQFVTVLGLIDWRPALLLSPENIELGGFSANLSSKPERLIADLSDTGGAIALTGDFSLSPQGAYHYAVKVGVRDTSVPGLLDAFNQLGRLDVNGKIALSGDGRLF